MVALIAAVAVILLVVEFNIDILHEPPSTPRTQKLIALGLAVAFILYEIFIKYRA